MLYVHQKGAGYGPSQVSTAPISIIGISVRHPEEKQVEHIHALAQITATFLELDAPIPRHAVKVIDAHVGPGYSLPTDEMVETIHLLAKLEGILLDPVYTGKAMAGLIAMIQSGQFRKGQNVLFVHTGGAPALYAYQDILVN